MNVPSRCEVVVLLRAIPRGKRAMFALILYPGLCSQKARELQLNHVAWARRVVTVTSMGGKQRIIPINKRAASYLRHTVTRPMDFA